MQIWNFRRNLAAVELPADFTNLTLCSSLDFNLRHFAERSGKLSVEPRSARGKGLDKGFGGVVNKQDLIRDEKAFVGQKVAVVFVVERVGSLRVHVHFDGGVRGILGALGFQSCGVGGVQWRVGGCWVVEPVVDDPAVRNPNSVPTCAQFRC